MDYPLTEENFIELVITSNVPRTWKSKLVEQGIGFGQGGKEFIRYLPILKILRKLSKFHVSVENLIYN